MRNLLTVSFSFLILLAVGCGPNVRVSGTVSFPDGTPLDQGVVVFESPKLVAKGPLNGSGGYRLGSIKAGDGLPPGNYKVYFAFTARQDASFVPPVNEPDAVRYIDVIDPKYASAASTPLTWDVKKSETVNLTVEHPVQPTKH